MRNTILANIWMLIGAFVGFVVSAIPLGLVLQVLVHYWGTHSPIVQMFGLPFLVAAFVCGRWFKSLFYKGRLPGYKPDGDS